MTVHERLEELIRTFFNEDGIVLTDDLRPADVPGWDSLAHVNLLFSVEQEFGVAFSDQELESVSTIGDLERILESKLVG